MKWLNYAALLVAFPTLFGLIIVGSFQVCVMSVCISCGYMNCPAPLHASSGQCCGTGSFHWSSFGVRMWNRLHVATDIHIVSYLPCFPYTSLQQCGDSAASPHIHHGYCNIHTQWVVQTHTRMHTHTKFESFPHTPRTNNTDWFVVYEYQYWQCCLVYVSADKWCEWRGTHQ